MQADSFLRSRPSKTDFLAQLARTQAVEWFAEWSLCPLNEAYLRVNTGVVDPLQIGDKVLPSPSQPSRYLALPAGQVVR